MMQSHRLNCMNPLLDDIVQGHTVSWESVRHYVVNAQQPRRD